MKNIKFGHLIKSAMVVAGVTLVSFGVLITRPIGNSIAKADYDRMVNFNYVTQQDIDDKKAERDQALASAAEASAEADALKGEASELSAELEELQGLSDEQMEQYEEIASQYAAALIAKAEALDEYVTAQENLNATRELFSERISIMFEYQNKSTLEVLLESDSIAGFFTNMEIITLIADSDDQAVDQMTIALDEAQLASDNALQEAQDLEEIAQEKQGQLAELRSRIGVTSEALDDVNTKISTLEAQEDELNAWAATLDGQIKELQDELYAKPAYVAPVQNTSTSSSSSSSSSSSTSSSSSSTVVSNGTLNWPTWTTWVTSEYGYRVHPVYGTTKFHSGIDIGAGMGDTVMASASGTVIYVEAPCLGSNTGGSGYGNYIIIDHGNGVSTLYAHLRDIYVSNGDYVSSGQAIGEVGSTGTSTGAHLHYEVRVYGSTVDPRSYLK